MRCQITLAGVLGTLLLFPLAIGCSSSSTPQAENNTGETNEQAATNTPAPEATPGNTEKKQPLTLAPTEAPAVNVPADATPDHIVAGFLQAIREGNKGTMDGLLTGDARKAIANRDDISIQPPGIESAAFEVGEVQLQNGGAYVTSTFSHPNGQGGVMKFAITWVLRQENVGWRIAGMAAPVVPGDPLTVLNFEDPDDMVKKLEAAEARLAALEQQRTQPKPPTPPAAGNGPAAHTANLPKTGAPNSPNTVNRPPNNVGTPGQFQPGAPANSGNAGQFQPAVPNNNGQFRPAAPPANGGGFAPPNTLRPNQ